MAETYTAEQLIDMIPGDADDRRHAYTWLLGWISSADPKLFSSAVEAWRTSHA